ncbi:MAG TPA: hypothetical protein DDW50_09715 [Firmicutes bacterium]|jgi:TPR repeat protein|nr:hypothetical protein [Bacillota bacterium]
MVIQSEKSIIKILCLFVLIALLLPISISAQSSQAITFYNTGIDYYQAGNYTEAAKCFITASELGVAQAQNILADMYENGRGVKQSNPLAVKWMTKAAEQGYALAQSNLGLIYEEGKIIAKDYNEALKWYRKAAAQNNAIAMGSIGSMYENGYGVQKNYTAAREWYRKGAELGDSRSQACLASLYYLGKGVAVNKIEARKWYSRAAAADDQFGTIAKAMVNIIDKEVDIVPTSAPTPNPTSVPTPDNTAQINALKEKLRTAEDEYQNAANYQQVLASTANEYTSFETITQAANNTLYWLNKISEYKSQLIDLGCYDF